MIEIKNVFISSSEKRIESLDAILKKDVPKGCTVESIPLRVKIGQWMEEKEYDATEIWFVRDGKRIVNERAPDDPSYLVVHRGTGEVYNRTSMSYSSITLSFKRAVRISEI